MAEFAPDCGIPSQLVRLLQRIGYLNDDDYFDGRRTPVGLRSRHELELAFRSIGIVGALCPRSSLASGPERAVPVVYVVWARDDEDAARKHRAIWSQSVVPVIIMADDRGFQIRNGFDYRESGERTAWSALEGNQLPRALVSVTADAIRSSTSWRDFSIPNRVDERIATDIRRLSDKLRADHVDLRSRPDVVTALIGRLLYLYVLLDRGIIDQAWVDGLRQPDRSPACPSLRLEEGHGQGRPPVREWPIEEVWRMFDAIDRSLNGSIFPIAKKDRPLIASSAMHLVRRALRSDQLDEDGAQQFSFLDVNYATLRTETISAIYECFFDIEGKSQRKIHGAFYTPAFVVDYILDESDQIRQLDEQSVVVDPACGSGAFLVSAFRHIVERSIDAGSQPTAQGLRAMMLHSIHGTELKAQAANVARFSLYLTMLDYLPEIRLLKLSEAPVSSRLFPDLSKNIVEGDAFARRRKKMRATHVVGNPPWTSFDEQSLAGKYAAKLPRSMKMPAVDGRSLAELFYWKAANDLCRPDGLIAFVLPTKTLIAPSAIDFPTAVADRTTVRGIVNLSHFRRKLFSGADEAATILFVEPTRPDPMAAGWRYTPKLSSQPVAADGTPWAILVDRGQVERFRQQELRLPNHHWYRDLMLQPLDRRLASSLEANDGGGMNVASFLSASRMRVVTGDSRGVPVEFLLGTWRKNDFRLRFGLLEKDRLPLDERDLHGGYHLPQAVYEKLPERLRKIFAGPLILLPRSQAMPHVVDGNAAYNSSLQGILFMRPGPVASRTERLTVLNEFVGYLQSRVARYLLSLFGRQWIVDQRRFETPDLKRLPMPYYDGRDLLNHPVSQFSEENFIEFARDRLGMPQIFADAVFEHARLREPFQNGKRSAVAGQAVDVSMTDSYRATLGTELSQLLAGTPVDVRIYSSARHSREVGVVLAPEPALVSDEPSALAPNLAEESTFILEEHRTHAVARILKSEAMTAWTAERAYADAIGIARSVMGG